MTNRLIALARSEDGTSIIEMGFVAPILALLLIGMVDMSRAYSSKLQVEQIAQRTVEKVQNDKYLEDNDFKTALKAEAAAAAGVTASDVTIDSWTECNNSGTKLAFTTNCTNVDDPYAKYVEVRIQKTFTPLFKVRFTGANANGTYTLRGIAGVRVV